MGIIQKKLMQLKKLLVPLIPIYLATLKSQIEIINGDSTTEGSYRKAIKDLIGGAPEAYDTLKEIADKLATDDDLHTTIQNALTEKASQTDLTAAVKRIATTESDIATLETSKDVTVTVTDQNYSTLYTIKQNKAAIQNVEVPKAASVKNNTLYL